MGKSAIADGALVNIRSQSEGSSYLKTRQALVSVPEPLEIARALGDQAAEKVLRDAGALDPDSATMGERPASSLGVALGRGDIAGAVRLLGENANPNVRLRRG